MSVWQRGPKPTSGLPLVVVRRAVFGVFLAAAGGADAAPFDLDPQSTTTLTLGPVLQTGAAARAYRAGDGCVVFRVDPVPSARKPLSADDWACDRALPPPPREWKLQRGEASVSLGLVDGGERSAGDARGTLAIDHGLGLGPLGGWQVHADVQINHPGLAESLFALGEKTHLSLTHGLPAGWTLQLTAKGATQGGLGPGAAVARTSEIAVALSRNFRTGSSDREHRVSLEAADQTTVNRLYGVDQRKTVASLDYAHTLTSGLVGANLAVWRLETAGDSVQNAARAEVKYSRRF